MKISKVETLRSAMEYIKALQGMLGVSFDDNGEKIKIPPTTCTSYQQPTCTYYPPIQQYSFQGYYNK